MWVFLATFLLYSTCSVLWSLGLFVGFTTVLWVARLYFGNKQVLFIFVLIRFICVVSGISLCIATVAESLREYKEEGKLGYHLYIGLSYWAGLFGGGLCALLYSPFFYDGNENTGRRTWKWFRELPIWKFVHRYFCLRVRWVDRNAVVEATTGSYPPLGSAASLHPSSHKDDTHSVTSCGSSHHYQTHGCGHVHDEGEAASNHGHFTELHLGADPIHNEPGKSMLILTPPSTACNTPLGSNCSSKASSLCYQDKLAGTPYASSPVVWAVHPHGILNICPIFGFGAYGSGQDPLLKDTQLISTSILFNIPLVRDLAMWLGGISATKSNFENALDRGYSVMVLPGGLQEFILTDRSNLHIYTQHTGFAKIAFSKQVPVIPVFALNENRTSFQLNVLPSVRQWFLKKIGHPFPTFFLGPLPTPVVMVVGTPVYPQHCQTWEQFHAKYYEALMELVEKYECPPYTVI